MGFTCSNANEYIRYLCNSIRFPIVVFAAAPFRMELPLQLGEFTSSVCVVAMAVLPLAGLHVGEIISKAIMNMVAYILGALLGYGLRTFSENEIGKVFLPAILFILIALGIFARSVIKKVKDGYDYVPCAFLMAMFSALVFPLWPDWLTKQFGRHIKTLLIAYAFTISLVLLLPSYAGDEVHNEVHKNISTLADIFKDLNKKCFEEVQQKIQSLIDSKEKSKFLSWEVRWYPHQQGQYKKIRETIRCCAVTCRSLSKATTGENLHLSAHLRDTCKEICSEIAKALTLLSDSMEDKTDPKPSIDNHLTAAQDLALGLIKNKLELTSHWVLIIISHLVTSVENIQKLDSLIKELSDVAPFKQCEQDSSVPELLTELESQRFIQGIQEMTTRAKQLLVAPMKNMVSRLFAYLKKLTTKCSFASDAPDTIQAPVSGSETSNVPKGFIPGIKDMSTRAKQLLVAPMENISRLFAYLKKLITKCSFPIGKSETQREELPM